MGLTALITDMLAGKLPSTNPAELARAYGIQTDHAAGYLRLHRGEG